MGLDGVEILMEVEDEFDVKVSDRDAERCRTVGDLARFVARLVGAPVRERCPTSGTFYRLRAALQGLLPLKRREIRPSAKLALLVPTEREEDIRERLAETGLALPAIARPRRLTDRLTNRPWPHWTYPLRLLGLGVLIVTIAVSAAFAIGYGYGLYLLLLIPLLFLVEWRYDSAVSRARCKTVGDAVYSMTAARDYTSVDDAGRRSLIDLKVRTLIAEQMGYPLERVQLNSRFREDLEID